MTRYTHTYHKLNITHLLPCKIRVCQYQEKREFPQSICQGLDCVLTRVLCGASASPRLSCILATSAGVEVIMLGSCRLPEGCERYVGSTVDEYTSRTKVQRRTKVICRELRLRICFTLCKKCGMKRKFEAAFETGLTRGLAVTLLPGNTHRSCPVKDIS